MTVTELDVKQIGILIGRIGFPVARLGAVGFGAVRLGIVGFGAVGPGRRTGLARRAARQQQATRKHGSENGESGLHRIHIGFTSTTFGGKEDGREETWRVGWWAGRPRLKSGLLKHTNSLSQLSYPCKTPRS